MPSDYWCYNEIKELAKDGIVTSDEDGNFYPDETVGRDEYAKMLALGLEKYIDTLMPSTFSDVDSDDPYYNYIENMQPYFTYYVDEDTGVNTFQPEDAIKREDAAVIVSNILSNDDTSDLSVLDQFYDSDEISDDLESKIAFVVNKGIMRGTDVGLEPQRMMTRAEATKLLYNMIKLLEGDGYYEAK